jgi:hypothetical protein
VCSSPSRTYGAIRYSASRGPVERPSLSSRPSSTPRHRHCLVRAPHASDASPEPRTRAEPVCGPSAAMRNSPDAVAPCPYIFPRTAPKHVGGTAPPVGHAREKSLVSGYTGGLRRSAAHGVDGPAWAHNPKVAGSNPPPPPSNRRSEALDYESGASLLPGLQPFCKPKWFQATCQACGLSREGLRIRRSSESRRRAPWSSRRTRPRG